MLKIGLFYCGTPFKSLNTIYLILITQKAQNTYRHVLEGADVGVLWSYVVEKTGEPGENHRPLTGDHYPATCLHRDSVLCCAIQAPPFAFNIAVLNPAYVPLDANLDHSSARHLRIRR